MKRKVSRTPNHTRDSVHLAQVVWDILTYIEATAKQQNFELLLELHDNCKPKLEHVLKGRHSWHDEQDEAASNAQVNTDGPAQSNRSKA